MSKDRTTINKVTLETLYVKKGMSMSTIAKELGCSVNRVVYWMDQHGIKRRSISDAIYLHKNPNGDPFKIITPTTLEEAKLLGLGIGLYWGEGTKANKHSVRLGNSNPHLIIAFIKFLTIICGVNKDHLKFGLQLFSDVSKNEALNFWTEALSVKPSQFYKITVTISGAIGTYRIKNKYGVLTIYYHNKKLRDALVSMLPT
ncbi:MAG TPA: hypothetical protein VFT49_01340 [Candidatus Saccharimonadales bacterium]|nr:hypothetical protein [Candidatus Saccharimonadales bacterium]